MPHTPAAEADTIDAETLEDATGFVLDRIDANLDAFGSSRFPGPASDESLQYPVKDAPTGWTPSFWTGLLWLADYHDGGDRYRATAREHHDAFRARLSPDGAGDQAEGVLTHDLGFLYTLAAWANFDRTGDEAARQTALLAADRLADRFHPAPGIIQAWDDHRPGMAAPDDGDYGGVIIDTMMNLPLLYRASAATGYDRYREIAASHAERTADHLVRDDGSTAHGFKFDVETGEPGAERTHQGYADDSCWSRGQAWALYGFALSYRHTGTERFLDTAREVAEYYVDHLPDDLVPPWDFQADEDPELRDTSAGAIAACGLFELASHLPPADPDRERYERIGVETLGSLAASYTTEGTDSNGILDEGACRWPDEVEQCTIWGDYFYVEGLIGATTDWLPFWCR
jgi:unsaturated chondroitin disaccharide hydrolase